MDGGKALFERDNKKQQFSIELPSESSLRFEIFVCPKGLLKRLIYPHLARVCNAVTFFKSKIFHFLAFQAGALKLQLSIKSREMILVN